MKYTREIGERAYTEHKVRKRSVYDVAAEIGTSPPNITRWSKRYERENPAYVVSPGSGFLDRLRAEAAGDAIPGFEDADDEADDKQDARDDAADETDPEDLLAFARACMNDVRNKAKNASDDDAAARFLEQAGKFAALIHRMQKLEQAREGLITMSRADVEQAISDIEAKAKEIEARGDHLRCVDCGRAFRQRRAMGEK